jgi:hypothetical protein
MRSSLRAIGLLADSINDASSTRKVYLLAGGLALLGIALICITVWFWRSTRHDPELLAPLEVMGDKRFRRLGADGQRELLDSSRPADAMPLRWGVERTKAGVDASSEPSGHEAVSAGPAAPAIVAAAAAAVAVSDPDRPAATVAQVAEPAPQHELDSMLAAFGAIVPAAGGAASPVSPVSPVSPAEPVAAAEAAEAAPAVEVGPVVEVESVEAVASVDAEPVLRPEDLPVSPPKVDIAPLVIVPVDHELGSGVADRPVVRIGREDDPAAIEEIVVEEPVVVDEAPRPTPPAIDPLLRMFDRES